MRSSAVGYTQWYDDDSEEACLEFSDGSQGDSNIRKDDQDSLDEDDEGLLAVDYEDDGKFEGDDHTENF